MPVFSYAKLIAFGLLALVIVGLFATAMVYRGNALKAEADLEAKKVELATAVQVNQTNLATIALMKAQKAKDDEAIASYNETIARVAAQSDQLRTDVETLQRTNNEVRSYLDVTIPSDLAILLNRRKQVDRNADAVHGRPAAKGVGRAVRQAPANR